MNNPKVSCGLLMYRRKAANIQFFLIHPGGPFYKNKDVGVWSIPKGLPEYDEEMLPAAIREFKEETGLTATPPFFKLTPVKQKSGKVIHAWVFQGSWDESEGITSNLFEMIWPPSSGKLQKFPEADRAKWFEYDQATTAIIPGQITFLAEALQLLQKRTHPPA